MKQIKLIINEFGPIKNQIIQIAPFMIFTGFSNLGKSYVNYLMYYFFSAFTEGRIHNLILPKVNRKSSDKIEFSLTINELRFWLNENAQQFMREFLGDAHLTCDVNFDFALDNQDELKVVFERNVIPDEIIGLLKNNETWNGFTFSNVIINGEVVVKNGMSPSGDTYLLTRGIKTYLQNNLFGTTLSKSVILPPARGAYVGETFTTKEGIATATGMFRLFLRDFDLAVSSHFPLENNADQQFFASQIKNLVNGELVSEKGIQYLVLKNGKKIPITASASSIKELCPLLFYIKNWSDAKLSICFEEPEAHLHPEMQMGVANLLAAVKNKGSYIQLTTHSDYFLQRINQLIKLGFIRKFSEEKFKNLCKEKNLNSRFYLDADTIKAYYFDNGTDSNTRITELKIEKHGIPFTTFFSSVNKMQINEDYINDIIDDYGIEM